VVSERVVWGMRAQREIWRSADGGRSWARVAGAQPDWLVEPRLNGFYPISESTVLAVWESEREAGLCRGGGRTRGRWS